MSTWPCLIPLCPEPAAHGVYVTTLATYVHYCPVHLGAHRLESPLPEEMPIAVEGEKE